MNAAGLCIFSSICISSRVYSTDTTTRWLHASSYPPSSGLTHSGWPDCRGWLSGRMCVAEGDSWR
jgi:hypothetical protein